MRYSGMILNDVAAAPGISVTFFTQGCPHRCYGCHNPETWEFNRGLEFTPEVLDKVLQGIMAQGIQRNLCIMGGEPLCAENAFLTYILISEVRKIAPETQIYIWTGYLYEDLRKYPPHPKIEAILKEANFLIDGPYVEELRDITLSMRGSSNQRIIDLSEKI